MKQQHLALYELAYSHSVGYFPRCLGAIADDSHAELALNNRRSVSDRYCWIQAGKVTKKQLAGHAAVAEQQGNPVF